ncbi:MAG: hypothetical protein ABII18_08290 [bacterium]
MVMLQKSETWDMMGIAFNRQWAFCDPNAAFDLLITSLECYVNTADTSDDNARVIDLLKTSFVASRTAIALKHIQCHLIILILILSSPRMVETDNPL